MKKVVQWHEKFYPTVGGGYTHISNLATNLSSFNHELIVDHIPDFPYKETYTKNSVIRRFPKHPIIPQTRLLEKRFVSYPFLLTKDLQTIYSKFRYHS